MEIRLDWTDIKRKFMAIVEDGDKWASQPAMSGYASQWYNSPHESSEWQGGCSADTAQYLREGFRAADFEGAFEFAHVDKMYAVWSEEDGDPDAGFLLGGKDDFFFNVEPSPAKPALTLNIEYGFRAGVPAEIPRLYGAFVASLIAKLEAEGYDLEVNILHSAIQLFGLRSPKTDVFINVKRIGEVSDFTEWSALFAPTGFRHLIFTAKGLAADKAEMRLNHSLGGSQLTGRWDIVREGDSIRICCNMFASKSDTPTEPLTQAAERLSLT